MKAKILVITPTLGNRNTLAKTIESVREIGGDMVKHIIVAPEQQISFIKETFGDIECLPELEGKKGIYAALNHGFRTYGKEFEYLTFINDDDVGKYLAKQLYKIKPIIFLIFFIPYLLCRH